MNEEAQNYFKLWKEHYKLGMRANIHYLDQAINLDPNNAEYLLERADVRYGPLDDVWGAIEDYTRVIATSDDIDDLRDAYAYRSLCYADLGMHQEVVNDSTWLIEHNLGGAQYYIRRSIARTMVGDLKGAIEDCRQACHIALVDKDDIFAQRQFIPNIIRIAKLYYLLGQFEQALAELEKLSEAEPLPEAGKLPEAEILFLQGNIYYKMNELEKSYENFAQSSLLIGKEPLTDVEAYLDMVNSRYFIS